MRRYEISDADWTRIEPLLKGRTGDVGRSGAAWRDLPERYGPWNSVFRCFASGAGPSRATGRQSLKPYMTLTWTGR